MSAVVFPEVGDEMDEWRYGVVRDSAYRYCTSSGINQCPDKRLETRAIPQHRSPQYKVLYEYSTVALFQFAPNPLWKRTGPPRIVSARVIPSPKKIRFNCGFLTRRVLHPLWLFEPQDCSSYS